MKNHKFMELKYAVVAFTLLMGVGLMQCQSNTQSETQSDLTQVAATKTQKTAPEPDNLRSAITEVAKQTIPSVVHIDVTQRREISNPLLPFNDNPFYHFFFNGPQMPRKFKQELKGLGTGMLMDNQGNILTNNHVVAGATEINVLLADGNSYSAELVGTDPKTDLAVIRIHTDETLPHIIFGDSDKMEVGDWVVAIGHPRGLDQTVTQGIVSAKHRHGVLDPSSYQDYIQTDAAINPGNSGGPLLNIDGQVIGVNAAIASQSGGFEGIGFAIPSNMAVHVAQALIDHGKVIRGWLGVDIKDIGQEEVQKMHLPDKNGALVAEIVPNGPASEAGIQNGDVIVTYQDHPIVDAATLQSLVADTPIGKKADIAVLRDGKKVDLTARIGDLEDAMKKIAASLEQRIGAIVRPLTDEEREKYNLEPGIGVAINSLDSGGVLATAGFEKDDAIVEINNIQVQGVEGFVALVKALPPHQQALLGAVDHRSGQGGYIQVMVN